MLPSYYGLFDLDNCNKSSMTFSCRSICFQFSSNQVEKNMNEWPKQTKQFCWWRIFNCFIMILLWRTSRLIFSHAFQRSLLPSSSTGIIIIIRCWWWCQLLLFPSIHASSAGRVTLPMYWHHLIWESGECESFYSSTPRYPIQALQASS